jgi:hypothetical protein
MGACFSQPPPPFRKRPRGDSWDEHPSIFTLPMNAPPAPPFIRLPPAVSGVYG